MGMTIPRLVSIALLFTLHSCGADSPLVLDHAWVVVAPGAPERVKLEQAGFIIAPAVNRHDGQGTASVTLSGGEVRLTAKAEGWFWTIDVSQEIESQMNEVFVRDIVGTTIERTFNATYP